jgi:hypothetical protein
VPGTCIPTLCASVGNVCRHEVTQFSSAKCVKQILKHTHENPNTAAPEMEIRGRFFTA